MSPRDRLLAWLEPREGGCLAAFVGGEAYARAPASRLCPSPDEARQWVVAEADAVGLAVTWVDQKPVYRSAEET